MKNPDKSEAAQTCDLLRDGTHFRGFLELLPAAVYTCEAPSGVITFYNRQAVDLWGREPRIGDVNERFCGAFRLWRTDGTPLAHADTPMALAVHEGRPTHNEEVVIEQPDGKRTTVLVNIEPLHDENGRLIGAVNVFLDTTKLKEAAEPRARLAAIVESSDDAIISKDLSGTITSWNQGAQRLFGYTTDEAVGKSVTMLIPTELHNEEPRILERVRRGERIDHYETVRRHKDGSFLDISLTVSPIADEHGTIVGASKIARDITDRKRDTERIALEQETTLRFYDLGRLCARPGEHSTKVLAELLDTAIWISKADKGTLQLHDRPSATLTLVAQHGFATPFLDFFATVPVGVATVCSSALAAGERVVAEDIATSELFAEQDARDILLDSGVRAVQSTPLVDSAGTLLGMISTHFTRQHRPSERECRLLDVLARQAADYVERKRAEQQREDLLQIAERARAEAEAANRGKDEFLAMLGHELRNPLSAVRNAITAATLDETSRARALEIARRQTDQLARIVEDLLDVARITRGRVPLRMDRLVLADVLQRTVDAARASMDERGHTLTLTLPAEQIHLEGDAARIEQAVANLLTNAAKYTDPGGTIRVIAERNGSDALIRVLDNGIGMTPDMISRVFDLFAQGERSLDRAQGGLGIGLTLVRRIIELHDGSVAAKSAGLGEGCEFVIRLPACAADSVDPSAQGQEPLRTLRRQSTARILMVEDNPDAAESLVMILELLGHHVRVVHDGISALDAARANVPDIMLVDIGLPGMNGYEVARSIRRDPALEDIVLVALTGYGRPADKADAMAAGFDYHLVKPVDLKTLGELVAKVGATTAEAGPDRPGAKTVH